MSTSTRPLIAVCGATGRQGGSVVDFLLSDPDHSFRVRGLTRNVESPKAKDLSARGIEVAKADMNDIESLKNAFEGAYGVFGVTNFWETASGETETQQGKNLVDAAEAAGVKHFVWSTLDHSPDHFVPHCDSKAVVDDYLKAKKLPRTSLYTVFYYENFLTLFRTQKGANGRCVADWPMLATDGPLGGYSVGDTGSFVLVAFKNPNEWIGKDMRVQADVFTPRQFVQTLNEILGKDIELKEVDMQTFHKFKDVNLELWANMEHLYKNKGIANRDLEMTRRIYPSRKDYRRFIESNKDAFLAALS